MEAIVATDSVSVHSMTTGSGRDTWLEKASRHCGMLARCVRYWTHHHGKVRC
jgi:hypothetical protein